MGVLVRYRQILTKILVGFPASIDQLETYHKQGITGVVQQRVATETPRFTQKAIAIEWISENGRCGHSS